MDLIPPFLGFLAGASAGVFAGGGFGRSTFVLSRLRSVAALMQQFRVAESDDERGRILRGAGFSLLLISIGALGFFLMLIAMVMATPRFLALSSSGSVHYWVAATVGSIAAFITYRRTFGKKSGGA